jgi:hypothetical protein
MRILVRADNPGGRGRAATVLKNQGLLVDGTDPITGPYTNRPVNGLRIDEIGPITITPAVYGNGIDQPPTVAAVIDTAYHANLWIVEPLFSQIKRALSGEETDDEANTLFDALKLGTHTLASVINGIKRPEGYTTANNVTFYLPKWVATARRIWC